MIPRVARAWILRDLAEAVGAEVRGRGEIELARASDLDGADERALAPLYDRRRLEAARRSRAGALVVGAELAGLLGDRPLLVSEAPKAAFARAVALLHPARPRAAGVHPTAVIGEQVQLGEEVTIGPHAVIGDRCRIGRGATIGAGAVLLEEVRVGAGAEIHPNAVIYPGATIDARATVLAGAVVGAPGFGLAVDERGRAVRLPHIGRVEVGEEAEIGANSTVDRATFGSTVVGARARLDNLVQVGHNATVGPDAMIAAQSGLSGSSELGAGAAVGGQSGLADHVRVGERARVAAKTAVFADVPPASAVAGIPARPLRVWRRLVAIEGRLPQVWRQLLRRLGAGSAED